MSTTERKEQVILTRAKTPPAADTVLNLVEKSLDDDKAQEAIVIDLTGKTEIADYMVIASGTSQRHVGAMAEKLREKLKGAGLAGITVEGMGHCDWVLIDAGDVLVHLFRPEVRAFYNLEKMWGEAGPVREVEAGDSVGLGV